MCRRTVASLGVVVLLFAPGLGVWALLRPDADLQRLYGRGLAILGVVAGVALLLWARRIPAEAGGEHADWVRSHRGPLVGATALLVATVAAVVVVVSSLGGQGPPSETEPAPTVPAPELVATPPS